MRGTSIALALALLAPGAFAQPPTAAPLPVPAAPAIDPNAWWESRERVPERLDPLGDRRPGRNQPRVVVDNGFDPLLYRLWGLPPLQTMVLRDRELVLEVWSRRPRSARQAISRVIVRRDGAVFVQARAGLGCCVTGIGKRVDIDAKIEADPAFFRALARDPVWESPRDVIAERPGVVSAVCVDGSAYDLSLLEYRRFRHLRRICEDEAVGQVSEILTRVLGAAWGKDPRFDVIFPRGLDFSDEKAIYASLVAEGGRLKPRTPGNAPSAPDVSLPSDADIELAPGEEDEEPIPETPPQASSPSILNP